MVLINSKLLKLIVTVSKPKLTSQFGLYQCFYRNKQNRIISSAYSQMTHKGPRPLVVCGPSGSGKGTLLKKLFQEFPQTFVLSVSDTTRDPRPGERDGVHYHFVDINKYEAAVKNGDYLEYATYGGNGYATSKNVVKEAQDAGKVCVLEIDINGAKQVRNSDLNPIYVFIMPPSIHELRRRLTGRGTETPEKIEDRINYAQGEIEYGKADGNFHKIILNSNLKQAYAELRDFIVQELEKQQKDGHIVILKRDGGV